MFASDYASGPAEDPRKLGNCNEAGYKDAADFFSSQAKSACYPGGIHISGLVQRCKFVAHLERHQAATDRLQTRLSAKTR